MLPELAKRAPKEDVHLVSLVCRKGGRYLVEKTPAGARWWAGLWTLPTRVVQGREPPLLAAGALLTELGWAQVDSTPCRPCVTRSLASACSFIRSECANRGVLGASDPSADLPRKASFRCSLCLRPHRKLLVRELREVREHPPRKLPLSVAPGETSFAAVPPIK